jgi:hypothetical protein
MACVSFVFQAIIQFFFKKVTNEFACLLVMKHTIARPKYKALIDESQIIRELFLIGRFNHQVQRFRQIYSDKPLLEHHTLIFYVVSYLA